MTRRKKAAEDGTEVDATTEDQKALSDYHAGDFQTTDPVTGEPRGKLSPHADQPAAEDE